MPLKDPKQQADIIDWVVIIIAILIASFGGITKHLSDSQEQKNKPSILGALNQGLIGGFSGSLATFYLMDKGFSSLMVFAGAGLAGFGGAAILRFVMKAIIKYVGSQNNETK